MSSGHPHGAPVTFGLFVAPNAGCLSVVLISEALHTANRLSDPHLIAEVRQHVRSGACI